MSGGQRRRLALAVALAEPSDLLILDEPTNHLDIESREALVEALTAYPGAVILVSHDMHLLSLVAERLWLVKDGRVAPYDDDLAAYRRRRSMDARTESRFEYTSPSARPPGSATMVGQSPSARSLLSDAQKPSARSNAPV